LNLSIYNFVPDTYNKNKNNPIMYTYTGSLLAPTAIGSGELKIIKPSPQTDNALSITCIEKKPLSSRLLDGS